VADRRRDLLGRAALQPPPAVMFGRDHRAPPGRRRTPACLRRRAVALAAAARGEQVRAARQRVGVARIASGGSATT
jgi:hypothetical protein